MEKTIYFDMDGTIANLYAVDDWLPKLRAYDTAPYREAKPLLDMYRLTKVCQKLQKYGIRIGVISWLSKESNSIYNKKVRHAKKNEWLPNYFPIDFDEIHIVKYGYSKRKVAGHAGDILFDDELQNCETWQGKRKKDRTAIYCKNNPQIIFDELYRLLNELERG